MSYNSQLESFLLPRAESVAACGVSCFPEFVDFCFWKLALIISGFRLLFLIACL